MLVAEMMRAARPARPPPAIAAAIIGSADRSHDVIYTSPSAAPAGHRHRIREHTTQSIARPPSAGSQLRNGTSRIREMYGRLFRKRRMRCGRLKFFSIVPLLVR